MAVDRKYGYVAVERDSKRNPLGDSEPVFLLRGCDGLTSAVMREYKVMCELAGCDEDHIGSMQEAIEAMELWQAQHEDDVKVPD